MKYLLDTCVAMSAMAGVTDFDEKIKSVILDENNQVFYSTVSMWEVEIKHQKIDNFTLCGGEFAYYCDTNGFSNLPLTNKHVEELSALKKTNDSFKHKDPFDRILIAQAKSEKMILITKDKKMKFYNFSDIIFA